MGLEGTGRWKGGLGRSLGDSIPAVLLIVKVCVLWCHGCELWPVAGCRTGQRGRARREENRLRQTADWLGWGKMLGAAKAEMGIVITCR